MKNKEKKYQLIFILLLLLTFSCKKELKSSTQKTPQELSDEARIKQIEMDDSIQAILSMKRELESLKAKKVCNCKPKQFRVKSKYAWVEFRMPTGQQNQKISIKKGSYKKPVFFGSFTCSRVYWTNLIFQCNPKSCKWEKVFGTWRTSNQCVGAPESSKRMRHVRTGYDK